MTHSLQSQRSQRVNPVINSKAIGELRAKAARDMIAPSSRNVALCRITGLYGHDPRQNHLLAALPSADLARLLPHLEFVHLSPDTAICEADSGMTHIYFLTSSIVSMLHETVDGNSAETAVIGNEGAVGVSLFMGGRKSMNRITVKCGGYGFRMKASVLSEEFAKGGALQQLLLRYTHALISQMSLLAVCNRHHGIPQQLCRWLLLTLDRLPKNEIGATQNLIAVALGVRRESIAEAAKKLQDDGIIQYSRGHITVLNRKALEARTCECYQGLKMEYDSLVAATNRENNSIRQDVNAA